MNRNSELGKNTILIFISKFFTSSISFLLIPLYTRFLTTADYGYIDLIQTYIALLAPILILRFDSAIFRFLIDARKDIGERNKVISSSFSIILITNLIFLVIALLINHFLKIRFFKYIVLNILITGISQLLLQATRGLGNMKIFSIGSILSGLINVISNFIAIVIFNKGAEYILISSSIGNFATIIYIFIANKLYKFINKKNISILKVKEMLSYSLPMIPDGLSWWIVNVSDRTIITTILGTAANGIYAIAGKFSNILATIFGIFNMAWQESASIHIKDSDRDTFFSNIFNTMLKIYSTCSILIIAVLPVFFNLLVGKDYADSYKYIPLLLVGIVFNGLSNITGGIYIAKKSTKSVAKTTILSALINIAINLLLINKIGIWAACISTIISYIILCLYRYFDIKKEFKIDINKSDLLIILVITSIVCILYYINNFYLNIFSMIVTVIWSFAFNRHFINNGIHTLVNKIKN